MGTSTTPGLDPPQLPDPQTATYTAPKKPSYILGCTGIALGVFLAFFRAWIWSYGTMGPEAMGRVTGQVLLPALIAYLIAGRKRVRNFARFGLWFCGLSAFFFVVTIPQQVSIQQHMADLIQQAAGTKPVDDSGPERIDRPIRDMMRNLLQEKKTYESEAERFASDMAKLYTPESFSSKQAMQHSIDALRDAAGFDQQYAQHMQTLPERMQAQLDHSGLPDSFAAGMSEVIHQAFGTSKVLSIQRDTMEAEKQWVDATVSLYEFAMANEPNIRVEGPHLVVQNEKVRIAFNKQIKDSQTLRDQVVTLNTQLEEAQREALQQFGLTPQQLGTDGMNHPAK